MESGQLRRPILHPPSHRLSAVVLFTEKTEFELILNKYVVKKDYHVANEDIEKIYFLNLRDEAAEVLRARAPPDSQPRAQI